MAKSISDLMFDYFQDSINPERMEECAELLKGSIKNKELDKEMGECGYYYVPKPVYITEHKSKIPQDEMFKNMGYIPKSDVQEIVDVCEKGCLMVGSDENLQEQIFSLWQAIKTVAERIK